MTAFATGAQLGRRRVFSIGLMVALCATVLVAGFATASSIDLYAWDFRWQYLDGARAIVGGDPLYVAPGDTRFGPTPTYIYPPLVAVLVTPYTVLPDHVAMVVAALVCVCSVLAALAIVGVRDVRCYLAALASAPTWNLLETANVTALLVLALALAWRGRNSHWHGAIVIGLAVAAKLFLWPLVVWSWATRGRRVALRSAIIALLGFVGPWSLVRFQGLVDYPRLLSRADDFWADDSYSLAGVTAHLGLDRTAALFAMALIGGSLLVLCWRNGRRGDDRRAFTCAIGAALALTPIVWGVHYIWFLLVPLGLARPQFALIWLVPLAAWLVPRSGHGDGVQPFVPLLIAASLMTYMLRSQDERLLTELA